MLLSLTVALALAAANTQVNQDRLTCLQHGIDLVSSIKKQEARSLAELVWPQDLSLLSTEGFGCVFAPTDRIDEYTPRLIKDSPLPWVIYANQNAPVDWPKLATMFADVDQDNLMVMVPPDGLSQARQLWPGRTVLIGPLTTLPESADKGAVYVFDFVEPSAFLNQRPRLDLPYPSSPKLIATLLIDLEGDEKAAAKKYGDDRWNEQRIERRLQPVADWAKNQHVNVICRFGCPSAINSTSRLAYLTDVRTACANLGLRWLVSDFAGTNSLFRGVPGKRTPISGALKALGMSAS